MGIGSSHLAYAESQIMFTTGIIKLSSMTVSYFIFPSRWYKCNWSISRILARPYFLQETMSWLSSAATQCSWGFQKRQKGPNQSKKLSLWGGIDYIIHPTISACVLDERIRQKIYKTFWNCCNDRERKGSRIGAWNFWMETGSIKADQRAPVVKLVSNTQNYPASNWALVIWWLTSLLFLWLELLP